jgi:hypothetical protein
MSGTYQSYDDAPGGPNESAQAVRDGLAQAISAVHVDQLESANFLVEHGAEVLPGHAPVRRPGQQGDPDLDGADASDD